LYFNDKVFLTLKTTERRTVREDCHGGWTGILKDRNII